MASLETSITSCSAYRILVATKQSLTLTTTFWTPFTLTSTNLLMMMILSQEKGRFLDLIKVWMGNNLVVDILGMFGRLEVDKPKDASSLIEDKCDNSKVREGVADHLLLD